MDAVRVDVNVTHVDEDVDVVRVDAVRVDVHMDDVRVDVARVDVDVVGEDVASGRKNEEMGEVCDGDGDGDGDGVFLPVFGRLAEGPEVRNR